MVVHSTLIAPAFNMETCTGCGGDTTSVSHRCAVCNRANHVFCGIPQGEGFGAPVRCADCNDTVNAVRPSLLSAPPIIVAFARGQRDQYHQQDSKTEDDEVTSELTRTDNDAAFSRKRALQQVSSVTDRVRVVRRMMELHERWRITSSPRHQRVPDGAGWDAQEQHAEGCGLVAEAESILKKQRTVVSRITGGIKRAQIKATKGRGRKRAKWVEWLHSELHPEFLRLRSMHVKVTTGLLVELSKRLLAKSQQHRLFKTCRITLCGELV